MSSDIKNYIEQLNDIDLITLLNEISNEVKRRNTIMKGILGTDPPAVQRENIQQILNTILETIADKK